MDSLILLLLTAVYFVAKQSLSLVPHLSFKSGLSKLMANMRGEVGDATKDLTPTGVGYFPLFLSSLQYQGGQI